MQLKCKSKNSRLNFTLKFRGKYCMDLNNSRPKINTVDQLLDTWAYGKEKIRGAERNLPDFSDSKKFFRNFKLPILPNF